MPTAPDPPRLPVATPLPRSRALAVGLAVALVAGVLVTGALAGLCGSTETRYAEIGREMLESGDLVVPTLNGAPHLEKPPLTYWALALSFLVFGVGDVAARVPGLVAAALTVLVTAGAARRLAPARDGAPASGIGAAVVLFTMPAFVALARTVSTDVWLTLATTLAGVAVLESVRTDGRPGVRWTLLLHGALALGMLVKGPAVLLPPLAGVVAAAVARRSLRTLRPLVHPLGLLVLVAVSASWYAAAEQRVPGLFRLYLTRRAAGGVFAGEHHDAPLGVVWGPVLLGSMPWAAALFGAVPALRRRGLLAPLAAMALAAPVFFSFSASRLPTYGLPALPFLALMVVLGGPGAPPSAAAAADDRAGRSWQAHLRRATATTAVLVPLLSAAFVVYRLHELESVGLGTAATLAVASIASVGLLVYVRRRPERLASTVAPLVAAALLLAGGAAHVEVPSAVGANRADVERAVSVRRPGEALGVAVHTDGDWGLLPFYARDEATFFGYSARLSPRPPEDDAPERFRPLDGPRGLAAWFRAPGRRWLLLRTVVKGEQRDPWRRLGDGPVVVVTRGPLYSVVTNAPLEPAR